MPYIQLDGQQYPLIAGGNPVGGNEGARIRVAGNGNDGVLASLDVGADGSTVVRRVDGIVKVNGVTLGAEPAPLLHGDKIDVAGREFFFGDDRRAGNTQFVQPVRVAESAPRVSAGRPTAATGGRVISLVDGREYVDARAGLWYAAVGHGRAEIADAAAALARDVVRGAVDPSKVTGERTAPTNALVSAVERKSRTSYSPLPKSP